MCGAAVRCRKLSVGENRFTGNVPPGPWTMPALEYLRLSSVPALGGTLPTTFATMPRLQQLYMSDVLVQVWCCRTRFLLLLAEALEGWGGGGVALPSSLLVAPCRTGPDVPRWACPRGLLPAPCSHCRPPRVHGAVWVQGSLPNDILSLSSLRTLSVQRGRLSGVVPYTLTDIPTLRCVVSLVSLVSLVCVVGGWGGGRGEDNLRGSGASPASSCHAWSHGS
jgi:hypothetical protein